MSLLVKIIKHQETSSVIHRDELFSVKTALLVISYSSIIIESFSVFFCIILASAILLLLGKGYKIFLESLAIYFPAALLITGVNYVFATLTMKTFIILIYGYTVFITMIMLISTTPRRQFLRFLEKTHLDVAFFLVLNIVEELNEMLDSKKARGWEPGCNILKYYVILVDAIKLSIIRLASIEDALLARGVEKD
ncbi:MAG: hypothetical protein QXV51_02965 [Thermosphaera sp.]